MKHAALCQRIGYRFAQPQLLQRALTHRSHSAAHNERLEFLGDSLLNCVIARYLYDTYPDIAEGDLSRLRSNLVNQQTLATLAQQLQLGEQLLMGEGEVKGGGSRRPSILADALEALFGAVWLDADFPAAQKIILGL
ncbi:MAG: ribonuclease III, partial [Gallionellales bacterium CG08_land_8_20_14_0_20_59_87]